MPEKNTVAIELTNCLDCKNHRKFEDPDPDDWFCDDDMGCYCVLADNPKIDRNSKWMSDRLPHRCVTVSARPYNLRKECEIPDWCPLLKGDK